MDHYLVIDVTLAQVFDLDTKEAAETYRKAVELVGHEVKVIYPKAHGAGWCRT